MRVIFSENHIVFFTKSQQILYYCSAAILDTAVMLPTEYQTNFNVIMTLISTSDTDFNFEVDSTLKN